MPSKIPDHGARNDPGDGVRDPVRDFVAVSTFSPAGFLAGCYGSFETFETFRLRRHGRELRFKRGEPGKATTKILTELTQLRQKSGDFSCCHAHVGIFREFEFPVWVSVLGHVSLGRRSGRRSGWRSGRRGVDLVGDCLDGDFEISHSLRQGARGRGRDSGLERLHSWE